MIQLRLAISATTLALLAAACTRGGPQAGDIAESGPDTPIEGEIQKREAPRVRTALVERKEMVRRLSTTTAIESVSEIELLPRISGVVNEVLVDEADAVTAGQVLARLDPRDAQAALRDAEVALLETQNQGPKLELAKKDAAERIESAKLALAQAKRNVDANEAAGLISRNELEKLILARDQAERDLSTANLTLEQAGADLLAQEAAIQRANLKVALETLNLSYTEIIAPFDGVIADRMVEVGNAVTSGAGIFRLTDPENVRAIIYRPQRELAFFRGAGSGTDAIQVEVVPDALPNEIYTGQIRIVSPTIDATSGSLKLTIDLDQPSAESSRPRLLPGMLVRLAIVTERRPDSLAVPKRALRREGDRRFLFLVKDGHAVRVDVEEGLADDDEVQVLPLEPDALVGGESVIVVGNRDIDDGQEVAAELWGEAKGPRSSESDSTDAGPSDEASKSDADGETDAPAPQPNGETEAATGDESGAAEQG